MRETLYVERPPQTLRKHNNTPHRKVSTLQFPLNRKWKAYEAQLSPKLCLQLQTQHPTNLKTKITHPESVTPSKHSRLENCIVAGVDG